MSILYSLGVVLLNSPYMGLDILMKIALGINYANTIQSMVTALNSNHIRYHYIAMIL